MSSIPLLGALPGRLTNIRHLAVFYNPRRRRCLGILCCESVITVIPINLNLLAQPVTRQLHNIECLDIVYEKSGTRVFQEDHIEKIIFLENSIWVAFIIISLINTLRWYQRLTLKFQKF